MSKIRVDYELCNIKMKQMQNKIYDLTEHNAELNNLISEMDLYWDGASGNTYIDEMRKLESFNKMLLSTLHEYKRTMSKVSGLLYAADVNGHTSKNGGGSW